MEAQRRHGFRLAAAFAALLMLSGAVAGLDGRASAHEETAHPAHIHTGSCATPGDVVHPLSGVGSAYIVDGTPAAGERIGAESAIPVDASVTTVQAALADIVAGDHAIIVHESKDAIQNYIACGDVGGMMLGASDLPVGLAPLNDSGYSGIAWLHDNGDGTTAVSLFLTQSEGAASGGTDGGDKESSEAAAGEAVAVDIKDFAFNPDTVEIPAGTTVTWTNQDSSPHTVSQTGGGFESGKIDPGASFSFTFDTPGTYEYFCQYHANMKATIVVS